MDEKHLIDLLIRHAVASERLGKGDADKLVRLLNSADEDLMGQIAARYAAIEGRGYDIGPATTKRLEDTLEAIRALNTEVYAKVAEQARGALLEAAEHEIGFTREAIKVAGASVTLDRTIGTPTYLKTLVDQTPIDGSLLASWVDALEAGRMTRLEQALRVGLIEGAGTDDIVRRIRGTKANQFTDGILDISRRSAKTFALTANSTVANRARLETFKVSKLFQYVEWSSILDSRTSPKCQSLSGQIFDIDQPHPTPPVHPRCRSLLLPRKNNTDPAKHRPFGDWLRDQPADVQDEVLGPERAAIFRDDPSLDFAKFFREDGRYKTLAELKAHDASALKGAR